MAEKKVQEMPAETNDLMLKAQGFWDKYSKPIIIVGSAVIILIGGWFGYKYGVKLPNERKANELMVGTERIFDKMAGTSAFNSDSVKLVLEGNKVEGLTGMQKIVNDYGGTAAGNRAKYIVGVCYLQLGDFNKAIKYLKDFDGNGADQIQSKAYILLGHASAQLNKTDDALDYYKKAASTLSDKDTYQKATALYNAAMYADAMGKSKDAVTLLQQIDQDFEMVMIQGSATPAPFTQDDVDKLLAKNGVLK